MLSTRFCFFAHEKGKRLRFPFPVICIDSELLFIIYPHSGTLTQFLIRIPAATERVWAWAQATAQA